MPALTWSSVRLPGNANAPITGPFCFTLRPAVAPSNQIRACFEGPVQLSRSGLLVFALHSPTSQAMFPDIVRGDYGFPVVSLRNFKGSIFSFARGNLKDFFDIWRPNEPQTIRIPLSAFTWSRELRTNVPDEGSFFDHSIEQITFDFLTHPHQRIDVCLDGISHEAGAQVSPQASDLVSIERSGHTRQLPPLSSESPLITLGFGLNSLGVSLGLETAELLIKVHRAGASIHTLKIPLSPSPKYIGLRLPFIGTYDLDLSIQRNCETVARSTHGICRMLPRRRSPRTILGVSDEFNYEAIAAIGGSWDRLPVSLQGLREVPGGFAFAPGSSPFPSTIRNQDCFRIVAPYGMPKWLSRKAEQSDYHRYGPANWETYAKVVKAIVEEAMSSGVTHYEVWNEASALGSWNDDMETLLELHRVTYATVKSFAPRMTVIGGCTHSWTFDFLRAFLVAGGASHCDGLALHGYTYQPHEYVQQFDALDSLIGEFCPDRPDFLAHITEIGFRHPTFSLHDQAQYLVLYALEAASRGNVAALLYFRFQNPRPELLSTYRQNSSTGYAMVGYQGLYCRPSLATFRFIERLLQASDTIHATGPWNGRRYEFTKDGSVEAVAVFHIEGEADLPSGWIELDQYGERATDGNRSRLRFAVSPLMFEESF
jgi:hypothetical protein